ncbi:MAG: ribosome silencing factor [Spirochaetes bacterium]|nr:ribosome silencing factor [Spirochaetota bacterium]
MISIKEKVKKKYKQIDKYEYFNFKIFEEIRDLDSIEVINKLFLNEKKKTKDEISIIVDKIIKLLDEKKGIDIKVIDVEEIIAITSYIIIVTANSTVHAKSLANNILSFFKNSKLNSMINHRPDLNNSWILIDAKDILINIFLKETRDFYSLDKLYFKGKVY